MAKSKMSGTTIAIVVLALAVVFLGYSAMNKGLTTGELIDNENDGNLVINTASKFGDDNTGQFRPAVYNSMDTSATTYKAMTLRVYQLVNGVEEFYGTVLTATSGVGARSATNTLAITGYDENNNIYKYAVYAPASDNASTSGRWEFTASEDVVKTYAVPNQSALIFKVYDEEARGGLYTSLSAADGTSNSSGTTYGADTATTGTVVAAGGYYDYTIYFSTNGSLSTYNQFEDQMLLIAVDAGDLSDWLTPSLSLPGATVTLLEPGQYNDKIKNNGYDFIYKVTNADGTAYHVDSTWSKLRIQQYAKPSVNPADDVTVSLIPGGYYTQTVGNGMKMDTNKDDSSQTAVFTENFIILDLD